MWERATGKPIHPAIVWQDRRTAARCSDLEATGIGETVSVKDRAGARSVFLGDQGGVDSGPRAGRAGARRQGRAGLWHRGQLADLAPDQRARHVTDVTNASRTLLYNIVKGEWDAELLRIFGVPASMLPEVVWSSEKVGEVTTTLGLGGIGIAGIAGDQQAALFGQLCWAPGEAKNTYGTGCFLLQNVGTEFVRSNHRLITTLAASAGRRREYALEGSIFIGGAVVQWLRDNLNLIGASQVMWKRLRRVCRIREAWCLCRRLWDWVRRTGMRTRRGMLIGLSRTPSGTHCASCVGGNRVPGGRRAGGDATRNRNSARALRVDGGATRERSVDAVPGGLLGVPVVRPQVTETTALGAAYLAGLATGFWAGPEELRAKRQGDKRFEPRMDPADRAERRGLWQKAVERAKAWST